MATKEEREKIEDLRRTLEWVIKRIEEEADKSLVGKRPEWKKAATESVEEAYGALGRLKG